MRRYLSIAIASLAICCCAPAGKVARYTVKVEQEYAHDTLSYTQGLFFDGDSFYETAGQYGESRLLEVDLTTGEAKRQVRLEDEIFAEGSCTIGDNLYILTWLEGTCMVYDKNTFERIGQKKYQRQGWGLTTDGHQLIMSDGSAQLYFINPKTFTIVKSITVSKSGRSVNMLNELEWIDGKIWANIYLKDEIVIINPANGEVEAEIDCRGLLDKSLQSKRTDVLNGIAYQPATGAVYLTGKYWPRLFRVSLVEKK